MLSWTRQGLFCCCCSRGRPCYRDEARARLIHSPVLSIQCQLVAVQARVTTNGGSSSSKSRRISERRFRSDRGVRETLSLLALEKGDRCRDTNALILFLSSRSRCHFFVGRRSRMLRVAISSPFHIDARMFDFEEFSPDIPRSSTSRRTPQNVAGALVHILPASHKGEDEVQIMQTLCRPPLGQQHPLC